MDEKSTSIGIESELPVVPEVAPVRANGSTLPSAALEKEPLVKPPGTKKRKLYDCAKCPGYCCSYPLIEVTKRDVARLARHFALPYDVAEARFTKPQPKSEKSTKRLMRRQDDHIFGRICRFFDTKLRRCTIYEARPAVCRDYPTGRCGYYDFLRFERELQGDKNWTIEIDHR